MAQPEQNPGNAPHSPHRGIFSRLRGRSGEQPVIPSIAPQLSSTPDLMVSPPTLMSEQGQLPIRRELVGESAAPLPEGLLVSETREMEEKPILRAEKQEPVTAKGPTKEHDEQIKTTVDNSITEDDTLTPIPWQRHVRKAALVIGGLSLTTAIAVAFLPGTVAIPALIAIGSKLGIGISALTALGIDIPRLAGIIIQNKHMIEVVADANQQDTSNDPSWGNTAAIMLTSMAISATVAPSAGANNPQESNNPQKSNVHYGQSHEPHYGYNDNNTDSGNYSDESIPLTIATLFPPASTLTMD